MKNHVDSSSPQRSFLDKCLRDKHGKLVLGETPNLPMIGWIICKLLGIVVKTGAAAHLLGFLGSALLFTWAYLEIADGTTYLRRALGTVVMAALLISYAHR